MEFMKPFFIPSGPIGCLLIHGYNSGPFGMWDFAKYLAKENISSNAVLLAGHGDTPLAMKEVKGKHWVKSAEEGLMTLKNLGLKKIFVIGHSLGGLIALELASKYKWINGVITISAPANVTYLEKNILKILKHSDGYVPFFDVFTHRNEIKKKYKKLRLNSKIPVKSLASLAEYINSSGSKLEKVKCPVLIIQSKKDRVVTEDSAQTIYNKIKSRKKKILWLNSSSHAVLLESERKKVYKAAAKFIHNNT